MEHRTYYYARVSTKDQNLDRQLAAFRSLGASEREIITDKESGKDLERKDAGKVKESPAIGKIVFLLPEKLYFLFFIFLLISCNSFTILRF